MGRIMAVIAACALGGGAEAQAQSVYKCSVGGRVSYTEHPCAHGTATRLALPPAPAAAAAAAAADSLARDESTLAALEKERQVQASKAARDGERAARAAGALRQKCERLRLKAKWADEDLARAGGEAVEAARLKAKRQAQVLAVECPG